MNNIISQAQVIKNRLIANLRKNPRGWNVKKAKNYTDFVMKVDANLFIEHAHLVDYPEWVDVVHKIVINKLMFGK